jgi:hypothetical protein
MKTEIGNLFCRRGAGVIDMQETGCYMRLEV